MSIMQYSEMKKSGVEWIGDIPKDWIVIPFKRLIAQNDGGIWGDDPVDNSATIVLRSTEQTVDGKWIIIEPAKRDLSKIENRNYYYLISGDLLVTKSSGSSLHIGKTTLVTNQIEKMNCCYSNFMQRIRLIIDNTIPKFFWYILNSSIAREQFVFLQNSTSGIGNINSSHIDNIFVPLPPLAEQEAIAVYLDEKCASIDEIIQQAKATIEEYKAWKASMIFEAVTKGLDPNTEMKDSGVQWIGKIPKGWNVRKLKWMTSKITDGSHFSPETVDDGYAYITAKDVNGIGLKYQDAKKISSDAFEELQKTGCRPVAGDVLLVKDGATTGRVGLMIDNEPCVILSSVAILRPASSVKSRYLMYMAMSDVLQFQIRKTMAGSAMPRTTLSKLVDYEVVFCPPSEQSVIVDYLDNNCEKIDNIIDEKQKLIDELEAYKKSLIFETVTGKRRVC